MCIVFKVNFSKISLPPSLLDRHSDDKIFEISFSHPIRSSYRASNSITDFQFASISAI